jgi:hypothetical protein
MTNREGLVGAQTSAGSQPSTSPLRGLFATQWVGRHAILAEVTEIRGLMPLLMKQRNGGRWTREEQMTLRRQLRALIHLAPLILIFLLIPGSSLLIPLLAWWLDRRKHGRRAGGDDAVGCQNGNRLHLVDRVL